MTTVEMDQHLDKMTLAELREFNRKVVGRIRLLNTQASMAAAAKFKVGDLVEFVDDRRGVKVKARVDRINTKSLSCHEITGLQIPWRVAPTLCRLVGA